MFHQPIKSLVHLQLEYLNRRCKLSSHNRTRLNRMEIGYEGEKKLFLLLNSLNNKPLKIFNLRLNVNNSECQFDCLLLFENECIILEVKNYSGDYYISNHNWFLSNNIEIKNPLSQLKRSELYLRDFFNTHHIRLKISSFVIFINDAFHLYHASPNMNAIFPAQINRFLSTLNQSSTQLTKNHHQIFQLLTKEHITHSVYDYQLEYTYHSLNFGTFCKLCNNDLVSVSRVSMICLSCSREESVDNAIQRHAEELHTLFPDKKLSVNSVYQWTGGIWSKKVIRKRLNTCYQVIKRGKQTHYVTDITV